MGSDGTSADTAVDLAVRLRVPAKVNLFLAVRGLRDDGYHELVSIMQTVGLHDELSLRLTGTPWAALHPAERRGMRLAFQHDAGEPVPSGDENLVLRAASALLEAVGAQPEPADGDGQIPLTRIDLAKRIPVAAGMAGGSADAAAALVGLNHLWDCGLDRDELRQLAGSIGADVPFCVHGGTALATGTGTATAQVLVRGRFHWVIGISAEPLATPQVYRTFDEVGQPTQQEPDAVLQALRTGDAEILGAALHNDLESAARHLRPSLGAALDALRAAGALGAIVSGSGPTVVGLAEDPAGAERLAQALAPHVDRVATAQSPAGGPELERLSRPG